GGNGTRAATACMLTARVHYPRSLPACAWKEEHAFSARERRRSPLARCSREATLLLAGRQGGTPQLAPADGDPQPAARSCGRRSPAARCSLMRKENPRPAARWREVRCPRDQLL
ncbi:hypothetical protein Dimus_029351, partial [Dionaea muscipula]